MQPALLASSFLLLFVSTTAWAERPECQSSGGKTVCGYHCVSEYGRVACAQTPAGACTASYGRLTCWDPPGDRRDTRRWPPAECISNYGTTVCGYSCVAEYGQIRCAQTPEGVCTAAYGRLTCWEPPRVPRYAGRSASRAECVSQYGRTACGYSCVADYGEIRCAQTPEGVCMAAGGRLTCWEPSQATR